jgi:hypothetical protein
MSMKSNYKNLALSIAALLGLWSCEDVVFPELQKVDPAYVVDAWITNSPQPQTIKLMRTQPYFENTLPPGVTGATVIVETIGGGPVYTFTETEAGVYTWTPAANEVFGQVGESYKLTITKGTDVLISETDMSGAPAVDSITFNLQKGNSFIDDLYFAEFWSTDLEPVGDAYWIRTYKNGVLLNKPSEISLAYDAAFSRGADFSGVIFISPIRSSINPFDEDKDGNILSPYVVGDSLYVEVNSLSEAAFDFLTEVQLQTDRPGGFQELFSTPLANVPTNITNTTPGGDKAVGFFNVAAVQGNGRRFKSLDEISKIDD